MGPGGRNWLVWPRKYAHPGFDSLVQSLLPKDILLRTYLPPSSLIRRTKYRLESVTASTAIPGYVSTGHLANNSPEMTNTGLDQHKFSA